jgi:GTP-binding protein HflX
MSEISLETGRQIGVLINRKGQVEYVMVGNAKQIEMPDFGRSRAATERFRGLRCIHTHLQNERLTQDDLTDLALLRLDLMSIIQVEKPTGLPGMVYSAHLLPTSAASLHENGASLPYEFLEPNIPSQLDTDFSSLITSLESEMARVRQTARAQDSKGDRVILVGVTAGYIDEAEESMAELEELALSADVFVLDKIIQRRPQIDPKTVLGKGKLEELLIRSMRLGADLLVFDTELSPGTGAIAFRSDGSKGHRSAAIDPRHLRPACTVARRKTASRVGTAQISFAASSRRTEFCVLETRRWYRRTRSG